MKYIVENQVDIPAQTSTNGESSIAVSYGLGSNGGYTLRNENDYKPPKLIEKLSPIKSPYEGEMPMFNTIDEIPTLSTYYDGENKLNVVKVTCRFHTNRNDCLHQSGCGWCGERNSCIKGNLLGPTEPCLASTFVFVSTPIKDENTFNEVSGPLSITIKDHYVRQ